MGEWYTFAARLVQSRWLVIAAAILIQCSAGVTYSFGIYSQTIKDTFNYDQEQLDTLASWKDLGANTGVVSGLVFDRFSAQGVLAIGIVLSGLAYLAMYLSVAGIFAVPQFSQMCLYMFFAQTQTFFSTACVVTCVQNFPRNRGVVIGLMKGFLGLSGAVLTQVYHGVYGNEPTSFLLMAAWLPSVTTLLLMVIIRPVPTRGEKEESRNLFILSLIALCLALFLMGVIFLEGMINIGHYGYVAVLAVISVMLLLPMGVAVVSERESFVASTSPPTLKEPLVINSGTDRSCLSSSEAVASSDGEGERCCQSEQTSALNNPEDVVIVPPEKGHLLDVQPARKGPSRGEEHTIPEAMGQVDFWLLFLAMACGMGGGLTAIDNTGQIGASLGYTPEAVGTFISLFSIWNFSGRLGFGALSELFLQKFKIGRPVLLAGSQACMSLGYVLISSALPGSLYPALIVIGFCYGAQWSLMPAITSELFGLKRFATLFNAISIASPIGAYFLSVQVTGRLYDMEAAKDQREVSTVDFECYGAHCFRLTFIILAAVSLLGCTVCSVLVHRTKAFYARIVQNSQAK
ncbi:unnamed protein product [Calypogeia fissa]